MADLKKTNFVVVACDFEDGQPLDELWLLGWDSRTDWFTAEIDSQDIMTPEGNLKECRYGSLIETSKHECAYVGHEQSDCQEYCDSAIKEGYECAVCRVEWVEGEWRVYKA
jgi:hypothetical protein